MIIGRMLANVLMAVAAWMALGFLALCAGAVVTGTLVLLIETLLAWL